MSEDEMVDEDSMSLGTLSLIYTNHPPILDCLIQTDMREIVKFIESFTVESIPEINRLRTGEIFVTAANQCQYELLMELAEIAGYPVAAKPALPLIDPRLRGKICGVPSCYTIENIISELAQSSHQVNRARRIGEAAESKVILLEFATLPIPTRIKLFRQPFKVKPYTDRPLQCFNCRNYGHLANKCGRERSCKTCGEKHIKEIPCPGPMRCSNCGSGKHESGNAQCRVYIFELDVLRLSKEQKITFPEARAILKQECKDEVEEVKEEKKKKPDSPTAHFKFLSEVVLRMLQLIPEDQRLEVVDNAAAKHLGSKELGRQILKVKQLQQKKD